MSALTARLAQNNTTVKMYSVEGATFQEKALGMLDYKGSEAHKLIGSLVTAINNNQISVNDAFAKFTAALSN